MESSFLSACEHSDSIAVERILLSGEIDVNNCKGKYGRNALFYAAKVGACDVLELLLNSGADATVKNDHGFTPLYVAALHDKPAAIRTLTSHHSESHVSRDSSGISADRVITSVTKRTAWTSSPSLLHAADLGGLTPLHIAASKGHLECVSLLLQLGADPTCKDSLQHTPLFWADLKGHKEVGNLLKSLNK